MESPVPEWKNRQRNEKWKDERCPPEMDGRVFLSISNNAESVEISALVISRSWSFAKYFCCAKMSESVT
jgi:hypothetical protein